MLKPIKGSAPQPASEVTDKKDQASVSANTAQTTEPKVRQPIYSAKARIARQAERFFEGQARAANLQAELERAQSGSVMVPRMKWETSVGHSDNNSVPTPYPNIADASKKDDK